MEHNNNIIIVSVHLKLTVCVGMCVYRILHNHFNQNGTAGEFYAVHVLVCSIN